jgi:hypothetical protein
MLQDQQEEQAVVAKARGVDLEEFLELQILEVVVVQALLVFQVVQDW